MMKFCDWMPNDNKLVLRGPGNGFYHQQIYGPPAKALGLKLSYKTFMSCIPAALKVVASELPGCDPEKLRFGRCESIPSFQSAQIVKKKERSTSML